MLRKVSLEKSDTADTRTCDVSTVTREQLRYSSVAHRRDVMALFESVCTYLKNKAASHDMTKLEEIDWFYEDFKTGFKKQGWYDMHRLAERHHIAHGDGVPFDVDLFDVLEHLVDNVTSCVARTGDKSKYIPAKLRPEMLAKAIRNTEMKLLDAVECPGWEVNDDGGE